MKIKKITPINYSGDVYNLRIKSNDGLNHNYIANSINVANCHKSGGATIRDILVQCSNWEYRLGLSGTVKIEEEFSDFFRVQEIVGPLVMTLSAKHLIDHGYSPNIKIDILDLKYDETSAQIQKYWHLKKTGKSMYNNAKDFGRDMLAIEKGIIFESKERLDFISNFTRKLAKNTLILFSDVKNGYGRMIQEKLLEWNDKVYYIDGGVDSRDRDKFKDLTENPDLYTELVFPNKTIVIHQYESVQLSDKSFKLAKDITIDDDILDAWIINN